MAGGTLERYHLPRFLPKGQRTLFAAGVVKLK
jgi:hypothetical protein